jgi:surface antigen
MMRNFVLSLSGFSLLAAAPAAAQFPFGISSGSRQKSESQEEGGCKVSDKRKRGSRMAGNLLGGLANRAIGGRAGAITSFVPLNVFTNALTDAIACQLDKDEQKQAVAATEQAIAGGVGTKTTWTSATRQGVTGASVVTASNTRADGASCMTVDDVIIVEGEETTVSKQMCRAPGGSGYVLSA